MPFGYTLFRSLLRTRPPGMSYGVPFGYTLIRSLLRTRPPGMNCGVPYGYTLIRSLLRTRPEGMNHGVSYRYMYICGPAILPVTVRICGFASLPYGNFAFLVVLITLPPYLI